MCTPSQIKLWLDILQFKSWLNNKWNKGLIKENHFENFELDYPYITANNCSISRKLFFQLDGFDSRLKDAEDYDLAVRAKSVGVRIFLGNRAFAWHNDITNCIGYIKRLRQYNEAQKYLLKLKPEFYKDKSRYLQKAPIGLKGLIFRLLCFRSIINLVDKGYLKFLPAKIRFRIYDMVVTANGSFFPEKVGY
jgi:GT2 family glycosyltransferase